MANYIRFWDSVSLKPLEITQEVKDFYAQQPIGQPLRIKVAATHAGKITRNNGFYLPHKMRAGTASWTGQYSKPIQVHHNDHADPVGRVVSASYVDISGALVKRWDSLKDSAAPINSSLLDAFNKGTLSFKECVDVVGKYFLRDEKFTDDPDYEGLGYISLVADISDPEAIKKVLDKRYLTGSVGASTNEAVCSICERDWASEEGPCDHSPGKVYDSLKCVLIAGDLTYDEWSFVNRPADAHSSVIEINVNGVQDFVKTEHSSVPEITLILDSEGDKGMTFKKAIQLVREDERFKEVKDLEKAVKTVLKDLDEGTDEKLLEALLKHLGMEPESIEGPPEPGKPEDQVAVQDDPPPEEDPVKVFWGDEYDELVGDDEWGVEYAKMIAEALQGELKGEDGEDLSGELKDAKLTAAGRKKLSKSVFCKPPRGYPVHDCCLVYDTEIKLLDGTTEKIGNLVDRVQSGEEIWVYGFDTTTKSVVPAKVSKAWLAVKDQPIYRVRLDNDDFIDCTGNHPFLLKDGTYRRADELTDGFTTDEQADALMPLYTKRQKNRDGLYFYEMLYQPWYNYWEYTHHMVVRGINQNPLGSEEQVHHKNSNKRDNRPANLEQVDRLDHIQQHFVAGSRVNELSKEFVRLYTKALKHITPINVKVQRGTRKVDISDPSAPLGNSNISLQEIRALLDQGVPRLQIAKKLEVTDRALVDWLTLAGLDAKAVSRNIREGSLYREAVRNHLSRQLGFPIRELYDDLNKDKDLLRIEHKYKIDAGTTVAWLKQAGFDMRGEYKSFRTTKHQEARNHRVKDISVIGTADAYDIEVPATSNFALAAGVFVHNSHAKSAMAYAKKNNEASSVVACIRRKAKRLGCPFKADQKKDEVKEFSLEYFDALSDEDLVSIFDVLQEAMTERSLSLTDPSVFEEEIKGLKEELSEKKELEDRLSSALREIGYLCEDIDNLQDQLNETILDHKSSDIVRLRDLKVLSGEVIEDFVEFEKSYAAKSFEDVRKELETIEDNVDIKELGDKLNCGLANQPEGTVDSPLSVEDNKSQKEKVDITEEQVKAIREAVQEIRITKGPLEAKKFIKSLVDKGLIQKD